MWSGSALAAKVWPSQRQTPLAAAYDLCEAVTREHSKSFYVATIFLPEAKRRAIRALYAFCRATDDLVDEPDRAPRYSLDAWRARAFEEPGATDDPILLAWADTRLRYALSREVIEDLIAGVRMDLTVSRYESFAALERYCYHVASTVGLLSMQIIGHDADAHPYAIRLGVALQLTNILRDVGEDARRGRVYLPQAELEQFGLHEAEIVAGCCDERYHALMRFQIARARTLYDEAWPGIMRLHPDGRFAVAAAADVYRAILDEIEHNQYDNHTRRAFVPARRKLALLASLRGKLRG